NGAVHRSGEVPGQNGCIHLVGQTPVDLAHAQCATATDPGVVRVVIDAVQDAQHQLRSFWARKKLEPSATSQKRAAGGLPVAQGYAPTQLAMRRRNGLERPAGSMIRSRR